MEMQNSISSRKASFSGDKAGPPTEIESIKEDPLPCSESIETPVAPPLAPLEIIPPPEKPPRDRLPPLTHRDTTFSLLNNHSIERQCNRHKQWKKEGDGALMMGLSAMYGLLIVVLGLCFPLSGVISSMIPTSYYDGFYMYLYITAILFLIYVYTKVKRIRLPFQNLRCRFWGARLRSLSRSSSRGTDSCYTPGLQTGDVFDFLQKKQDKHNPAHHHGSFYLRCGAVVFGVGSMIYSGLDFGQYFEMKESEQCQKVLRAITPAARACFTFIQMYFVFLNSKMFRKRHPALSSFGLMHLVATNLCVWLNVIIQETKHEILHVTGHHHADESKELPYKLVGSMSHAPDAHEAHVNASATTGFGLIRHKRGSLEDECMRTKLMGSVVQDASPFLFPCAIEYSLLCAAIMYEMWKTGSAKKSKTRPSTPVTDELHNGHARRSPHHYSVDCSGANKGLFLGIFVFVLCIISMIMFFVLIRDEEHKSLAILEIHTAELVLYLMTFITVMIGLFQVRELRYNSAKSWDLDNILLVIALAGVMAYNAFSIVGGYFGKEKDAFIVLITAVSALIQASAQTLFIIDASHRTAFTQEQQLKKPGREIVTFLLVTNFAMWALITLEKSRSDAHPVQFNFFGIWPWAVITNVSMPLSIFYRYHSTVCLFEIWKRSYKIKPQYAFDA